MFHIPRISRWHNTPWDPIFVESFQSPPTHKVNKQTTKLLVLNVEWRVPQVALLAYVVQLILMHSTNKQEWISLTLILLHSSSIPKTQKRKEKNVWIFGWSENRNWATKFYCPTHQKTQRKVRWQWGRCQNDLKLKPPRAKEKPQKKGGKSSMKKKLVHKISWSEHQQTEKS